MWRNSRRAAISVVGAALVLVGLALLVLPGPGLLVIIAGLAVLATEYAWAQKTLEKTKEKAKRGAQVIKNRGRTSRGDAST